MNAASAFYMYGTQVLSIKHKDSAKIRHVSSQGVMKDCRLLFIRVLMNAPVVPFHLRVLIMMMFTLHVSISDQNKSCLVYVFNTKPNVGGKQKIRVN